MIEPWVPVFYEAEGFGLAEWITIGVGVGAAVVGSVVGGWISWLQMQANRQAEKERDTEDRVDREKAKLITAQFRCSLILSDVTATVASINYSLTEANERGLTSQPLFTRLMPVIGNMATPPIDFDALAPLIRAKENDLVHAYVEMHAKHEVLAQALARFDVIKEDLNNRVSPHMRIVDGAPMVAMTDELEAQLRPYFDGADSLARQIRVMAEEVKRLAELATFGIGPVAKRLYNDEAFPVLVPTELPGL